MSTSGNREFTYIGSELELFGTATRWKGYLKQQIAPYVKGRVLEVGAGLGTTANALCGSSETEWVCLEPDPQLAGHIDRKVGAGELPGHCRSMVGTTQTCVELPPFDTILYVDVLEHIEDDHAELLRASGLLSPGGYLVVLGPAHQWLFTPFDEAIGHYRRYDRRTLITAPLPGLRVITARYLDCAGLLASAGNRLFLRSTMPTARQIRFWDNVLVRLSRSLDSLFAYRVGKSVLVVWQKDQ